MYVKRINLRNFKSFPKATLELDRTFSSIVGPNGSGKSNVIDALLFAFGEMRLKSMRVKSTKDLIFKQHNVAEVSVVLAEDNAGDFGIQEVEENGKTRRIFPVGVHEVRRLIRKDGKTKYVLDGKRVKKYVIDDFLAQNAISLHHVIKQGEVQRIVEMNSKDRRSLLDFVSNVSEYEDKKREAFLELSKVDDKLKEAQTVFAEREGYLKELEQDKKNAEKFLQLEAAFKRAAATLLHLDVVALEKELEELVSTNADYRVRYDQLVQKIKTCEALIDAAHAKKDDLNKIIAEKSQGREMSLQKEIDHLEAQIAQAKNIIEDKSGFVKKNDERKRAVDTDLRKVGDEIKGFERQKSDLESAVKDLKKLLDQEQSYLDKLLGQANSFSRQFFDARKTMETSTEQMQQSKDELSSLQAEVAKQQELSRLKADELVRLKKGIFSDFSEPLFRLDADRKSVKSELLPFERSLSELFEEEKEINHRLPSLEKTLLELQQKITESESKLRAFGDSSSKALESVLALRSKEKGIYGTVGELIRYPSNYSVPVSVAMGNRFQYVVVDSVKTAGRAIEHLKAGGFGRVSFIPLDKIQIPRPDEKMSGQKGSLGFIVDLLEFDSAYRKAIEFAAGGTLLMRDFASAESLVNKARMVTSAGDLFEPSGLVTGGKAKEKVDVFAETARQREASEKFQKAKTEKEALVQRLYSLRDQMSVERKKKAELEVKLKGIELEIDHLKGQEKEVREKQKDLHKAIGTLDAEIDSCEGAARAADEKRGELIRRLSSLNVEYLEAKQKVDVEKEQQFGNQVKEREHKVSDLKISLVRLENEVRQAETQRSAYARTLAGIEREAGSLIKDVQEAEDAIKTADAQIHRWRKDLREKAEEQKAVSKEVRAWVEQREELEKVVHKQGNEKGKLQLELDKLGTSKQYAELKRVAVETKLMGLNADFMQYDGIEVFRNKTDRADLILMKKQAEEELKTLGSPNLRAVEQYDQKKEELDKQRVRVDQLVNEKTAVLALVAEIEVKKITTFMNTYNLINAAFRKLFKTIFHGDGTLFLENPEKPFDGGLTIQVQLENKEIKYLELMSGGEKSLIALLFLFALQSYNPSSIYILDEADAALDKENSRKLGLLLKQLSVNSQFLVVSHNEALYKHADCLIGVAMSPEGSQLVGVRLNQLQ